MAADQTDHFYLKPAEGRRVRHPDGRLLDAAGDRVEPSSYWDRLIADQDVEITTEPKPGKSAPAPKTSTEGAA